MSSTQATALSQNLAFTPQDRSEIEAIAQSFRRIWNEHQIHQLEPLLTEDAELINPIGMWWRGRSNIVRALTAFHSVIFREHKIHHEGLEIRPITPDVAVAVHTQRSDSFLTPDGIPRQEGLNRWVMTFVKREGKWLIANGQATPIDEPEQKSNPIQSEP